MSNQNGIRNVVVYFFKTGILLFLEYHVNRKKRKKKRADAQSQHRAHTYKNPNLNIYGLK